MSLRTTSKNLAKKALVRSGIIRAAIGCASPTVAILRYHSVQEHPEEFADSIGIGIIHSKKDFEEQMELVAKYFHPVSLDDVLRYVLREIPVPQKAVAVTFDDGFADNYTHAAPILDRFQISATFFITVESVEKPNDPWFVRIRHAFSKTRRGVWTEPANRTIMPITDPERKTSAFLTACKFCAGLSGSIQEEAVKQIEEELDCAEVRLSDRLMMDWDQIKMLKQIGHTIGSHTMTHPNVACLEEAVAFEELAQSKSVLETRLNSPVVHFSYPSPILQPHWTAATLALTQKAGYQTAVTCTSGAVRAGDNPLALRRIWVPFSKDEFLWNLEATLLGRHM